jgi:demethoxyubiquinone hydroxylase (CLK1/Coq7/Cat5 family)
VKHDVAVLQFTRPLYSVTMSTRFNDGDAVRILDQSGNVCAEGVYRGTGIPARELNAKNPTFQHYAVVVEGEMRYYPTGFHSLIPAKR